MIGWLWRVLVGTFFHEWEVDEKIRVYSSEKREDTVGYRYILRCKRCGDFKVRDAA